RGRRRARGRAHIEANMPLVGVDPHPRAARIEPKRRRIRRCTGPDAGRVAPEAGLPDGEVADRASSAGAPGARIDRNERVGVGSGHNERGDDCPAFRATAFAWFGASHAMTEPFDESPGLCPPPPGGSAPPWSDTEDT